MTWCGRTSKSQITDNLLEESVSPLEPGVVGVARQSVVQGALSPGQEVGGALGKDLDSQGHYLLRVKTLSKHSGRNAPCALMP